MTKAIQAEVIQADEMVRCNLCDKTYASKSILNSHIKRVHVSLKGNVDHECKTCGKRFRKKQSLTSHYKKIHLKLDNEFECEYCQKHFLSKKGLKYHVKQMHF